MLLEIETSTIVSYWMCKNLKKSKAQSTHSVLINTIEQIGLRLEHADSSLRVNVGLHSIRQFQNQCRENIEINEKKIILKNLHKTQMKRVLRRNFPNYATFELMESILNHR